VLKGLFDGYSEHRSRHAKQADFEHLQETEYLYSSDYLQSLYGRSGSCEQKTILLDYMERFEVNDRDYEGYFTLGQDIKRDLGQIKPEPFTPAQKAWIIKYLNEGVQE